MPDIFGHDALAGDLSRPSFCIFLPPDFREFIRGQSAELTEFDETLVMHWIRKLTVHPDRMTFEFKTGDIVEI
ncbi:hypothetical protein [Succinimonas amylolytica]|uniref:hypothetical protein n=1 Tax=Succinimonas amylolytica TaxID=83769 RepID=UPI000372701B|nr:hypothetical protein [Succinimonas amylolytica]